MKKLLTILIFVLIPSYAFAVGGTGSTCDPSKAAWGSCSLVTMPPWGGTITSTVEIPGGTTPYTISSGGGGLSSIKKYVLQGNLTVSTTAITISASYVVLDLNGYTITYDQVSDGVGISIGYVNYVAVVNGTITQGAANDDGTNGVGNNPIYTGTGQSYVYLANLYLVYTGQDVSGISLPSATYSTVEQCTLDDNYGYGLIKNRGQGVNAIDFSTGSNNTVKYNTIIDAKHRGIAIRSNDEVYQNHVTVKGLNTNSYGIGYWNVHDSNIHDNTVIARGAHPIGIGFVGQVSGTDVYNVNIYNNYIDAATTMYCYQSPDYYGDSMYASGIRVGSYETSDVLSNVKIYDNEIYITTTDSYLGNDTETGAPTYIHQRAKGLFIGTYDGGDITIANNLVVITGDGTYAYCITPHAFPMADEVYFIRNTFVTHVCHVVLEDAYAGTNPTAPWLFLENNFIKTGSYGSYYTVCSLLYGYSDQGARFVDNTYTGGASESSYNLINNYGKTVSVYFGDRSGDTYTYYRRLSNSGSSIITTNYDPATTLGYSNPTNLDDWGDPPAYGEDATAPVVTITTTDPSDITLNSLSIAGTASDAVGVTLCKWRLSTAPDNTHGTDLTGTTAWSGTASGFSSGSNTLYVGCRDATNNWGTDSMTVIYTIHNVGCVMQGGPGGLR